MKRIFKPMITLLLAAALIWGSVGGTAATDGAIQPPKEEVVYAGLAADGAVESIYVVNVFDVAEACVIEDYGSYADAVNLTGLAVPKLASGRVTVEAEAGRLYYQGTLRGAQLPWTVKIAYTLDGQRISADSLAGKSGALVMTVSIALNPIADEAYVENYLLQTTVTLDTSKAADITADGATAANAGDSKALTFALMPGSEAEYVITANVSDFEMDAVTFNAVPMSFDFSLDDVGGVTDSLTELTDAVKKLKDGADDISSAADDMAEGAAELATGSRRFRSGIKQLSAGSSELVSGSEQIRDGLAAMALGLAVADPAELAAMAELPASIGDAADGLRLLGGSLTELGEGFGPALTAIDDAITALPAAQDFSALAASTEPQVLALLQAYGQLATAAGTVSGTWTAVEPAFQSAATALPAAAQQLTLIADGLDDMAAGLEAADMAGTLATLQTNISALAAQYSDFHDGLAAYAGGVDDLSDGYRRINNGFGELADGLGEYATGVGEYSDGVDAFNTETATMDERLDEEIENLLAEFDRSDFVPPSFTSPMNRSVTAVQFVIKAAGIEKAAETAETVETDAENGNILDRLMALFG